MGNKSVNKLMISPSNPKQLHKLTYDPCAPIPPAVFPLSFFVVLLLFFLDVLHLLEYKLPESQGMDIFSSLCLTYKYRNEYYIWNIFWRLWWFTVLHLCKHFVFSPAANQLPLLDLLSLILSVCCSFLCCRAEMDSFESIFFTLIYFLQSHITPGLDSHCLLQIVAPTTWSYWWFLPALSVSEECGLSFENCTWFLKKQKLQQQLHEKELCYSQNPKEDDHRVKLP